MVRLFSFLFDSVFGQVTSLAIVFAAIFGWWQMELASARNAGRLLERAKMQEKTDELLKKADAVSDLAASGKYARMRADPHVRRRGQQRQNR